MAELKLLPWWQRPAMWLYDRMPVWWKDHVEWIYGFGAHPVVLFRVVRSKLGRLLGKE